MNPTFCKPRTFGYSMKRQFGTLDTTCIGKKKSLLKLIVLFINLEVSATVLFV